MVRPAARSLRAMDVESPAPWVRRLDAFVVAAAEDRRWLWLLLLGNLGGSVFGFDWYKSQLAVTPWLLWPVTADSPLATLLFTLVVGLWLAGRRSPALEALAALGLLKYGFWTIFVLGLYWLTGGRFLPIDGLLFATHGWMVVQGLLVLRAAPPGPGALALAAAWYFLNDAVDYFTAWRPWLPDPAHFGLVRVVSAASTGAFWWLGVLGAGCRATRAGSRF